MLILALWISVQTVPVQTLPGGFVGAASLTGRTIEERAADDSHLEAARRLNRRALESYRKGDFTDARETLEEALRVQIQASRRDRPTLATTRNSLGSVLVKLGEYQRARKELERALEMRLEVLPHGHSAIASTSSNLGGLLWKLGEYTAALPHLERALDIWVAKERPEAAIVLNTLGLVHQYLGDFERSASFFERALRTAREKFAPEHPLTAAVLKNLGLLLLETGDASAARKRLEEAFALEEKLYGPDHPDLGTTLNHLGWLRHSTGEYEAAQALYERSLEIREKVLGAEHTDVAWTLSNLGWLHHTRGDLEKAKPLYERALAIRREALGADHPLVAHSLKGLALLHLHAGDALTALRLALRAETIDRESVREEVRLLAERAALRYAAVRGTTWGAVSGLDVALSLCPALDAAERREIWDALIRSRAIALDEMSIRQRVAADAAEFETLRKSRERYSNLLVRGPAGMTPSEYRRLLLEAREEKERAERELAKRSLAFRSEESRRSIGYVDVSRALEPGQALVAYALHRRPSGEPRAASYPAWYSVLVLRAGAEPRAVALGSARDIEARVKKWKRQATRDRLGAYREAGAALRESMWDPIAGDLEGIRYVFVVPDGVLHLVNLAALPVGGEGYLVETGPIVHYLSSERDLIASRFSPGAGLLALGGAAFDAEPSDRGFSTRAFRGARADCGDFASLRFEELPATLGEVEEIRRLWKEKSATILTDVGATEAAFKELAPGRRVIHVATHGFFLGAGCPSAVASTRGIGGFSPSRRERRKEGEKSPTLANPLHLSGLALAGANRRAEVHPGEDDGIVTAEEISALDLAGVEWAVLSACDTGAGEIQAGEGVLGLRRAFQIAGVRSVIMSLWPVEDRAARRWMELLYHARFELKRSTADAVHEASLGLFRERRAAGESTHPFYWAAFVAAGDWR